MRRNSTVMAHRVRMTFVRLARFSCAFLLILLLLPCTEVFGATYVGSTYLTTEEHPEHHWADIQITYSVPDKVKTGGAFTADVSLTYVKNENAQCAWLEFSQVGLHLREWPVGDNVTGITDWAPPKRLKPGEQYTMLFQLNAPNVAKEYFVILTWNTLAPETKAYGLAMGSGEVAWDTGKMSTSRLIKMTVETDYTPIYIMLGIVGVVVLVAIFALVVRRNRKAAVPQEPKRVTPRPVAYCGYCGAQMTLEATLCPRCGAEK